MQSLITGNQDKRQEKVCEVRIVDIGSLNLSSTKIRWLRSNYKLQSALAVALSSTKNSLTSIHPPLVTDPISTIHCQVSMIWCESVLSTNHTVNQCPQSSVWQWHNAWCYQRPVATCRSDMGAGSMLSPIIRVFIKIEFTGNEDERVRWMRLMDLYDSQGYL